MKVDHTNYTDIIKKYKNGLTLSAIGKEYNCTYVTIRKILQKNNIDIRPYNQFCDITGQRFFRFTIIKFLGRRESNKTSIWLCKCDCGREVQNDLSTLKDGKAKSCGKCHWVGEMHQNFWNTLERGAIRRGYEFLITKEQAWTLYEEQNGLCALSGIPIGFGKRSKKKDGFKRTTTASLDRIDNKKGYTIDNIQWVHKIVNKMKTDLPSDEFIEFCILIGRHMGEK